MIAPYVVLFAITTALVAFAGSQFNKSALVRWILSIVTIALVSIFAGARDYMVGGPDVLGYGNKVFTAMLATPNLGDLLVYSTSRGGSGEVGYYFLNWIVARFSSDPHVFYAVLAAFTSAAIVIAILLLRDYGPPAVMWLTYMLTAYIEGFNLLRQSASLALAVLGIALVLRSRYKLGLIVGASGILFHNSAVVFLVMWGVARYLMTRKDRVGRAIWVVLIVSILALAAVAPILELLSNSLADSKYQTYLGAAAESGRSFSFDALYRVIPILLGIWVLRRTRPQTPQLGSRRRRRAQRQYRGMQRNATLIADAPATTETLAEPTHAALARRAVIVILVLLSLELILLPVREISYPFYRLLVYFGYLKILAYGLIVGLLPRNRIGAGLLAVAFAAAYFWLIVIQRNEAYYASEIFDRWFG